mmetsp:Transcript_2103/g.2866  ORF Transcript_2103/g.2866 Transcript_2103/m.2866 type:complete len:204 (+) Transcript_2103:682-1293(+)
MRTAITPHTTQPGRGSSEDEPCCGWYCCCCCWVRAAPPRACEPFSSYMSWQLPGRMYGSSGWSYPSQPTWIWPKRYPWGISASHFQFASTPSVPTLRHCTTSGVQSPQPPIHSSWGTGEFRRPVVMRPFWRVITSTSAILTFWGGPCLYALGVSQAAIWAINDNSSIATNFILLWIIQYLFLSTKVLTVLIVLETQNSRFYSF